ncbi:MAG TPA: hypothetical protein VIY47_07640, partial [Ignavibacteriaceae bacterium]
LYAHYELSATELKREVIKYLKTINPKDPLLARIKDINENRFVPVGKYMYILNHGGDIPENVLPTLIPALEKMLVEEERKIMIAEKENSYSEKIVQPAVVKLVPTIQDRLSERAHEVAGEIEGWIDDFCLDKKSPAKTVDEFVRLFKACELKAPHMRHMQNIFERRADEIARAAEGKDKDLNEGYSNFTASEIKKFHIFHQNLLGACIMLQEVAKVARAPRKKKPVSQEKLVARLKFKKEDSTLGIVSPPAVQILGAREVWVYNTKTRKLAQYKAFDERGILVKGASLENFSSDSAEKTVRKPAETLADFKKASKVKLRTFLKELSTVDIPAQGKLNEHHIILRIDK